MEFDCPGSANEIYTKIKTTFEAVRSKKNIPMLNGVDFNDASKSAVVDGQGFSGTIQCLDNKIVIDLKLGLLLKPMRGKIEQVIRDKIKEATG